MNSKVKNILQWVLSGLILIVSVYFTVNQIDFDKLLVALQGVNYWWTVLPIPIVVLSHWMRAVRWKTFLAPFFEAKSTLNLFSAVMIGYLFNNILPRGGEFIRPYVISKREKVSYTSVFGTIIVERVIDLITLLMLFALSFAINSEKIVNAFPDTANPQNLLFLSVAMFLVIFLGMYAPFVDFMLKILVKPFSQKFYDKLHSLFEKFRHGFAIIKTPSRYFKIVIESLLIWAFYALPLYVTFFAFPFQDTLQLGWEDALLLIIVSGVGVTIAPVPGAVGVYHWLVSNAMFRLYGLELEMGLAYATVVHAVNLIIQIILGGAFVFRENITSIPNIKEENEADLKAIK